MALLVNVHICLAPDISSKRAWAPVHCVYVICRLLWDIFFMHNRVYCDVVCCGVLLQLYVVSRLTSSVSHFKHENVLPYICMLCLGVCGDICMVHFMTTRRLRFWPDF